MVYAFVKAISLHYVNINLLTAKFVVKNYITHDAIKKIPPIKQITPKKLAGNAHSYKCFYLKSNSSFKLLQYFTILLFLLCF